MGAGGAASRAVPFDDTYDVEYSVVNDAESELDFVLPEWDSRVEVLQRADLTHEQHQAIAEAFVSHGLNVEIDHK